MQELFTPTAKNSDIKVTEIFQTYDYSKFKFMADNRNVNLLHVKRLIESFNEKHLICPIIVNEKYEVIDGQHRLTASMEAKMPIYYYIAYGYGINEVQKLNTNQKNWTKMDYMEMYAAEGKTPYVQLKKFMSDYPDFGITTAQGLISGRTGSQKEYVGGIEVASRFFEEGRLKVPDIKKSYEWAKIIMDYKPFFKGYNNPKFVAAIIGILDAKIVTHKELLSSIEKAYSKNIVIAKSVTTAAYRDSLEEIYNYRKSEKKSFRYL